MNRPLGLLAAAPRDCAEWAGRKIAVAGLGKSGLATIDVLQTLGVQVIAFDGNPASVTRAVAEFPQLPVYTAEDPEKLGEVFAQQSAHFGVELLVISPGIPAHHPLYQQASIAGIPVWSEVELAWQIQKTTTSCPDRPWLTLTGTNGKTTTVGMTRQILEAAGETAVAVGNVGEPVVLAAAQTTASVFAVELSSFQLHATHSLSAEASVVLNLDEDHVDWHGSVADYWATKAQIHERTQRAVIYNAADPKTLDQVLNADVLEGARAIGFTRAVPDIYQLGVVEDLLVDRAFISRPRQEAAALASFADFSHLCAGQPTPALLEDALAAAALTRAHGVAPEAVGQGLRDFKLAAHRRQVVGHQTGVAWINDSKATNCHAAANSLAGCAPQSVVWIAGGDAKGQDFHALVKQIAPVLRGVILIGTDKSALRTALAAEAATVPIVELEPHDDFMMSVVHEAVALSRPGDQVILAPACASWDQFRNYEERGDQFVAAVQRLQEQ